MNNKVLDVPDVPDVPEILRIACAAGFSGDRTDAARPVVDALIEAGGPSFLIFETLAERTLALAQIARLANSALGYEPLLDDMLRPVLADCLAHGIRIVSNFGAANPRGAARRIAQLAAELGLAPPRIAVVSGDDVSGPEHRSALIDGLQGASGAPGGLGGRELVSANAYLGAQAICDALKAGAQIVVCGRVADPSLTVGPAMAHFGWAADEWDRLARATMAGHLLECGAQVTGGYYADPGIKDIEGLARLGYPIAEMDSNGECVITKPAGSGGRVDEHIVKEQLLYEVHDPAAYVTPDVVADLNNAQVEQVGLDRVRLRGVVGHPRTASLKVNVCWAAGWLTEAEISYAGARAEGRARLAAQIIRERLAGIGALRIDLIGVSSVFADDAGNWLDSVPDSGAADVRLRIALKHPDRAQAERLGREMVALYTCGPAGGGGVRTSIRPTLGTLSFLMARRLVKPGHEFFDADRECA